jgi:hypothetical protein
VTGWRETVLAVRQLPGAVIDLDPRKRFTRVGVISYNTPI